MAVRITTSDIKRQQGYDSTLYVEWLNFNVANTKEYKVVWESYVVLEDSSIRWTIVSESTISNPSIKYTQYTVPDGVSRLRFSVTPVSDTHLVNNTQVPYYTAEASTYKYYTVSQPVEVPPAPTIETDTDPDKIGYITVTVSNIPDNISNVSLIIIRDTNAVVKRETLPATNNLIRTVSYSLKVSPGYKYSAKVQYTNNRGETSKWSDAALPQVGVAPASPTDIKAKALLKDQNGWTIQVSWPSERGATSYVMRYISAARPLNIQEVINQFAFGATNEIEVPNNMHQCTFVSASAGYYYFQVKSVNMYGSSEYILTDKATGTLLLGEAPYAPTTWSDITTLTIGNTVELYWSHNSKDGSNETEAEIQITFGSSRKTFIVYVAKKASVTEYSAVPSVKIPTNGARVTTTSDFSINTDKTGIYDATTQAFTKTTIVPQELYKDGVTAKWKVRTAAIGFDLGEFSMERSISIYAKPEMELYLSYDESGTETIPTEGNVALLGKLPFYIHAKVLSGFIEGSDATLSGTYNIVSLSAYTYVNDRGETVSVSENQNVWSYFSSLQSRSRRYRISAGNTDFIVNNQTYRIDVSLTVNTGFTVQESVIFRVAYDSTFTVPDPNASIRIDTNTYTAQIGPYCRNNDVLVPNILLSVYRKEYDGTLTEIATNIKNNGTFVTDPHPPLNLARYRIVATNKLTDESSWSDIQPIPINFPHIIIQWDESYDFYVPPEDALSDPPYSGSRVILPYNIDTNEDCKPAASLVEYIGRSNPVAYYGTMINETANWSCEIPKRDSETVYALRRLSKYRGDVYVREPSGVGYWANVHVTMSTTHNQVYIPVSLSITRVEGDI